MTTLISEQPVDQPGSDRLGYVDWARTISDVVRDSRGPLSVGVLGPWGAGKTSVLRLTQHQLREDVPADRRERLTTVWFNAWQYEHDALLLVPLICAILEALEADWPSTRWLDNLSHALRAVLAGLSTKLDVQVPVLGKVALSFSADKAVARYERLSERMSKHWIDTEIASQKSLQALRELDGIAEPDSGLVVFIDDLDRCMPQQALRLLEQVKLVLLHPGIRFVIALEPRVLESYLDKGFREQTGLEPAGFGRRYLEKIVQLPLWMPHRIDRFGEFGKGLLTDTELGELVSDRPLELLRDELGEALEFNPRRLVRLLNQFITWQAANSPGITAQLLTPWTLVERLREQHREAYGLLMESPALCSELSGCRSATDLRARIADVVSRPQSVLALDAAEGASSDAEFDALAEDRRLHYLLASAPGQDWL